MLSAMAKRTGRRQTKTRTELLAEIAVPYVLSESTRVTIEKMASEFVEELRSDPTWRQEVRDVVRRVAEESIREFRRNGAHSNGNGKS